MSEIPLLREIKVEPNPSIGYNNLTSASDGTMAFWHNEEVVVLHSVGTARVTQPEAVKAAVTSVQFIESRSGRILLCFTNRFQASIYDVARDVPIVKVVLDGVGEPRCCALVDVDGGQQRLVVGSTAGVITFFDLGQEFELGPPIKVTQHTSSISSLAAFRPQQADAEIPLLCSGDTDGQVCLWAPTTGALVASAPFPGECVTSIAFISASVVAVAFGCGAIRFFHTATCNLMAILGAHSRWINAMAFCAKSRQLASVGDDNLLSLCSVEIPVAQPSASAIKLLGFRLFPNALLSGVAFSPDGSTVFAAAYDTDNIWALNVAGM